MFSPGGRPLVCSCRDKGKTGEAVRATQEAKKAGRCMTYASRSREVPPPPLEMIGDLVYSPGSDLPFGKNVRIGLKDCIIYASAVETGYQMGIQAHYTFLRDHNTTVPVTLDDKQFSMVIKHLLPRDLSPFDQGLWRSFFIVGWTSVYLGLAEGMDNLESDETDNGTDIESDFEQ
jgi:hypothetical protein